MTLLIADPYLNTDAGTMSPFEHGEVFVLDDGGEVSISFLFIFLSSHRKKIELLENNLTSNLNS